MGGVWTSPLTPSSPCIFTSVQCMEVFGKVLREYDAKATEAAAAAAAAGDAAGAAAAGGGGGAPSIGEKKFVTCNQPGMCGRLGQNPNLLLKQLAPFSSSSPSPWALAQ